jgi:hypothetical protein
MYMFHADLYNIQIHHFLKPGGGGSENSKVLAIC